MDTAHAPVRFGINLMAWSATVGAAELALLPEIAAYGYDGVELPLLVPDEIDPVAVRSALSVSNLACTASSALPGDTSLLESSQHKRTLDWFDRTCSLAAECGATLLCGPLYAPVGKLAGRPRTHSEWQACVDGLQQVGELAGQYGLIVALEPLNRFETYFLNTAADAVRLVEEVGSPAIAVHLDTFHMNIEEHDLAVAITAAGPHLAHVHFSENDRGIVGTGHIHWAGVVAALQESGYTEQPNTWIVAETFSGVLPELAAAAAIWRQLYPDAEIYARESLAAMRALCRR